MKIAPSILAADLGDLRSALRLCAEGGADSVHVDVMDGHFVPNLTFGPPVIAAMAAATTVPLDLHLMVEDPGILLDRYLELRPQWLSLHWEAAAHHDRLLRRVRAAGVGAGLALNPGTPLAMLEDLLPELDFVLLMSVNPGFAGQPFLPYVLDKARRLRAAIAERGLRVQIQMDGGIAERNIVAVRDAGVDVAVVGSGIFACADPAATTRRLRVLAAQEAA
jgi:ribulose-phosphate 3-epimerase